MSAETRLTVFMTVKKANAVDIRSHDAISTATLTKDLTGNAGACVTQNVTTTDAALAIPADIGAANVRRLCIENKDASITVELSNATGGSFAGGKFAEIKAGEPHYMDPAGATIYAKTASGTARIQITACVA